jgi:phosphate transport system protein
MTEHTMKAFDADLQELARNVAEMGGLAEKLIADAIDALTRRDTKLAQQVIAADGDRPARDRGGDPGLE